MKGCLTAERVRELLDYEPDTGALRWRVRVSLAMRPGMRAGSACRDYRQVRIDGVNYMEHRVVWLHVTGSWPRAQVDHIDGAKSNNRWANLRDVSRSVNAQNIRKPYSRNKSGLLGAHSRVDGKFESRIRRADGTDLHLGCFDTAQAAHDAYVAAKRVVHEGCTL